MDGKVLDPVSKEDEEVDIKKQKLNEENKTIPSREERLQMFMTTFKNRALLERDDDDDDDIMPNGSHPMTFRDIASLQLDMYESGGFDVQDYSKVNDASVILTLYDPAANIMRGKRHLPELTECAEQAITQYNGDEGKHFGSVHVIKANVEPVSPYRYYITFQAREATEGITETFEAKVDIHIPVTERTVRFVRIRQPPCLFSLEDTEDMTDSTIAPRCVSCQPLLPAV